MDSENENSTGKAAAEWLTLDASLKKIRLPFLFTGLNIQTRPRKPIENYIFLFNFLWLNTDLIVSLYWLFEGMMTGKNFTELTYVSPCLTLSMLGNFKAFCLIANEAKIRIFLDSVRKLENNIDFDKLNKNQDKIARPEINFFGYVVKVLNVLNVLMIVVFDLCPLILIVVKYYKTNEVELTLPLQDVYPFDSFDIRYWPFAYIHQIWSECIVLFQICAADYLFFCSCTHVRIQFKLLKYYLERTVQSIKSLKHDMHQIIKTHAEFLELIQWHQELISSANMLEAVYSKPNLFNFLTSSLVICLTGFNVTEISDFAFVMMFIIFLFMSMLQIFFLCLFGDILMSSSQEISEAVYNCAWYTTDASVGRKVLLIQTRSQKSCKVTAAGFADVNLKAFMKILSTAWSYFALLQTVYSSSKH